MATGSCNGLSVKKTTISSYYENRGEYRGPYSEYERLIMGLLKPGMCLLDIGCGRTFPMAKKWLSSGAKVYGVDPVAEKALIPEGAEIIKGDAEQMRFDDQSFNIIISRAVMEHIERPGRVFMEIQRLLKPGGKVVLLTPSKYDYVSLIALLMPNSFHQKAVKTTEGRAEVDTFPTFYRANSHRQLRRLAFGVGLKIEKINYLDQSPYAVKFFSPFYRLAYLYHQIVRSVSWLNFLNGWIICVLSKPQLRP